MSRRLQSPAFYKAKFGNLYHRTAFKENGHNIPLDTLVWLPHSGQPAALVIICHPQPFGEVDMTDRIVAHAARACHAFNAASVRFNFRRPNRTQSMNDAHAALNYLKTRVQGSEALPVFYVGYSYGGGIAAQLAAQDKKAAGYLGIAPATSPALINQLKCPSWVIVGTEDSRAGHIYNQANKISIPNAGHYFKGKQNELSDALHDAFAQLLLPRSLTENPDLFQLYKGQRIPTASQPDLELGAFYQLNSLIQRASEAMQKTGGTALDQKKLHSEATGNIQPSLQVDLGDDADTAPPDLQRIVRKMTLCSLEPSPGTLLWLATDLLFDASNSSQPVAAQTSWLYLRFIQAVFAMAGNEEPLAKAASLMHAASVLNSNPTQPRPETDSERPALGSDGRGGGGGK